MGHRVMQLAPKRDLDQRKHLRKEMVILILVLIAGKSLSINLNQDSKIKILFFNSLTFKRASYLNNHIKGVHSQQQNSKKVHQESNKDSDDQPEPNNEDNDKDKDDDANTQYYCCLCKQNFNHSIFLVDHIKAFHTENVCVSCNKQFKVRSCLNRHIKESSCGTLSPQRSYPCTFCNFPFKRITHLNQHILRKHSNNPSLELIFENYSSTNVEDGGGGDKKTTGADRQDDSDEILVPGEYKRMDIHIVNFP